MSRLERLRAWIEFHDHPNTFQLIQTGDFEWLLRIAEAADDYATYQLSLQQMVMTGRGRTMLIALRKLLAQEDQ